MISLKLLQPLFQRAVSNQPFLTKIQQYQYHAFKRAGSLVTMKLETPKFQEIFTPELKQLKSLFDKYGFEIRIAGGAVRDLMMDKVPHDIDFATTATPDEMKQMFEKEEIRMINNKGEKHGTITARLNDKENFEVTTLRIDVLTDGRHAEVEFTTDWQLDANRRDLTVNALFLGELVCYMSCRTVPNRRDLTVNALFLDFDGTLYDYFNGKEDLDARRLRFVGSASQRIQEDYLRILRYFRFYGRIARNPDSHEDVTLQAIRDNVGGLAGISGERIWMEVKKIVTGRFNGPIMSTMLKTGVAPYIGLTGKLNEAEYLRVCERSTKLNPLAITFMAALLETPEDVYTLNTRFKMSTVELKTALFIVEHRGDQIGPDPFRYCMDLYNDTVSKESKVKGCIAELLRYRGEDELVEKFVAWTPPRFPITGFDLVNRNISKGPAFAKTLNDLRQVWKESNYQLTKEELLEHIDDIVKRHT